MSRDYLLHTVMQEPRLTEDQQYSYRSPKVSIDDVNIIQLVNRNKREHRVSTPLYKPCQPRIDTPISIHISLVRTSHTATLRCKGKSEKHGWFSRENPTLRNVSTILGGAGVLCPTWDS